MDDASQIPPMVEPLFLTFGATVEIYPVMTPEALEKPRPFLFFLPLFTNVLEGVFSEVRRWDSRPKAFSLRLLLAWFAVERASTRLWGSGSGRR